VFKLCAFGEPSLLAADGTRLEGIVRRTKPFALLLYLACDHHTRPLRRDELVAVFWPEADGPRGRNCLRQAVHILREDLGSEGLVATGEHLLGVDPDRLECDVRQFLLAVEEGALETALRLYAGDFLKGFFLSGAPEFGFWAEEWRARLKELAVHAAKNLAHTAEGDRALADAVFWWRRVLELTPFDEGAARRLLALLAGAGRRCEAMAEFQRFRHRMQAELEVEPSAKTTDLAHLVATAPPERIPMWVGDRRRRNPGNSVAHWRRAEDGRVG